MPDTLKIATFIKAREDELTFRTGAYEYEVFVGGVRRKPGGKTEAVARWTSADIKRMIGAFMREEYYNSPIAAAKTAGRINRMIGRFERAWDQLLDHCDKKVRAMAHQRLDESDK